MRVLARWSLLLLLPLAGCVHSTGVEPRRFFMDKAMKNEVERRELFEATLRVLDENPEYVDQLFRLLLGHRSSLNRFLAINASGLDDPQYAALMAHHLVRNPEPLTEVMVQVLEAAKDEPEAQRAVLTAIRAQKEEVAAQLLSDPETLSAVMGALAKRGSEDSAIARQLRSLVDELTPGHGGSGQEQGDKDSKPKQE
ncbi:hypothetical protein [Archangium lipolyticum]|uniref:hypothetical protein n=1 Tax=Archangium lipolyticum TaxID=2970465 RepID=UPI00214A3EAB|nr:hypothetical protein [Archangium lipolyticum]